MKTAIVRLWDYRAFVLGSVRREFQLRYLNTLLGSAWAFIQPLAMIAVYTLIFSQLMQGRIAGIQNPMAYSFYLCTGILTWALFAELVHKSQTIFVDHANLIKKMQFPKLCLLIVVLMNALIHFGIVFSIFTLVLIVTNSFPGWVFLQLLPILLLQVIFALGLGLSLGIFHVFFRDVGHLTTLALQLWFWATPIVYPITILSPELVRALELNPMTAIIGAYQAIIVQQTSPDWGSLRWPLILTLLICAWASWIYKRHARYLVDEL